MENIKISDKNISMVLLNLNQLIEKEKINTISFDEIVEIINNKNLFEFIKNKELNLFETGLNLDQECLLEKQIKSLFKNDKDKYFSKKYGVCLLIEILTHLIMLGEIERDNFYLE